jgi:hypothetical protein
VPDSKILPRTEKPRTALERAFLGKRVAGDCGSLGTLDDLYSHGRRLRSGNSCWTQHDILGEYFGIDLGDQVILAVGFAAPNLPELDGIYRHEFCLQEQGECLKSIGRRGGSQFPARLPMDTDCVAAPGTDSSSRGAIAMIGGAAR